MKKKLTIPQPVAPEQPFVMGVADRLSDDPFLVRMLGPRFKVLVDYDPQRKRVTYSFRSPDDNDSDEEGATPV